MPFASEMTPEQLDEMLKPVEFDWAEDVDEEERGVCAFFSSI